MELIIIGLIVGATHFLGAALGFGSGVIALPFVAMLIDAKQAIPLLVMLGWVVAIYTVARDYKHIAWRHCLYILFWAGLAVVPGYLVFKNLSGDSLKIILGVFVILISLNHLFLPRSSHYLNQRIDVRSWLLKGLLVLGGIIQGALGTGGPLIVVYVTRALPDKTPFRVTLSLIWLTLNGVMSITYISGGVFTPEYSRLLLTCLPFVLLAMLLGYRFHYLLNEKLFRKIVYSVLLVSGIALLLSLVVF